MKTKILTTLFLVQFFLVLGQNYERTVELDFELRPNAIAYGDLNSNGYDDLIVSFEGQDFLTITPNEDGSMGTPQRLNVGSASSVRDLIVADINNDNLPDIEFVDLNNNLLGLLINQGNLIFGEPIFFETNQNPVKVISGDLDNSGTNDLITLNRGSNLFSIYHDNESEILSSPINIETGNLPVDMELTDMNNDGYLDLLVANQADSNIGIHFGGVNGFSGVDFFDLDAQPTNIEVVDIDSDGNKDLSIVYLDSPIIHIFYGNGNLSFDEPLELSATENVSDIDFIIDDFNSDGINDIATCFLSREVTLSMFIGNGDKTFDRYEEDTRTTGSFFAIVGLEYTDLRNTGKSGFLRGNSLSVVLFESYLSDDFQFNSSFRAPIGSTLNKIAMGDINSDGINDIVAANHQYEFVTIYYGTGDGEFEHMLNLPSGRLSDNVKLVDLNNDTSLDLVVEGSEPTIFINDGNGNFTQSPLTDAPSGNHIYAADFNEDGYLDLVVSGYLYLNDQNDAFEFTRFFGYNVYGIETLDYNLDGHIDLVLSFRSANEIRIYTGNGDGTFGSELTIDFSAVYFAVTDLNNDGYEEIIATDFITDRGHIYFGDTIDPFEEEPLSFVLPNSSGLVFTLDVNQDEKEELVFTGSDILYFPVNEDGSLGEVVDMEIGLYNSQQVFLGDYNNDQFIDLISLDSDDEIYILTNKLEADIMLINLTQVYDGAQVDNIVETNPELDYTVQYNESNIRPSSAGSYKVVVTIVDDDYKGSVTDTLTVEKAALTIHAQDTIKYYGSPNPAFQLAFSGFQGSDDEKDLDSPPTIISLAEIDSEIGQYEIELAGGADNNYDIELVNGILTIQKANLSVSAHNHTIDLGDSIPELSYSIEGFVLDENESVIDVLPTISTSAQNSLNAGDFTIQVSGGEDNRYNFNYNDGILTIEKAVLRIIAQDDSINVGDPLPELIFTYDGFITGHDPTDLDILPNISTTAQNSFTAGKYEIQVSGGEDNQYDFVYENGTLTIVQVLNVENTNNTQWFSLFPNPATDHINIQSLTESISHINVLTSTGQLIMTQNYASNLGTVRLDTSNWPAGLFIIEIVDTNEKRSMRKVMVYK